MSAVLESPTGRAALTVEVRRRYHLLELILRGSLDAAMGHALLNDLVANLDPGVRDVHLDLAAVHTLDREGVLALDRCRSFAAARGARFRITELSRTMRSLDVRETVAGR